MNETRRLAAVMFTDIIGYTALMSRDEQKALELLQKNREIQTSLARKYNGEFLKEMGDGTLLCFQSALGVVRRAMEIRQAVKGEPDLNLRTGIHLGYIVFREGDVFGDGVSLRDNLIEGMKHSVDDLRNNDGIQIRNALPLQINEILHLAPQICRDPHVAHQAGIIHRDTKTENIFIKIMLFKLTIEKRLINKEF